MIDTTLSIIYAISPVLLIILLVANKTGSGRGIWIAKPSLSVLFILVAVLQTQVWSEFHFYMLAGFILCLLGDVLLIPESKTTFFYGLIAFLTGHFCYIGGFYQLAVVDAKLLVPALLILLIDALVYAWLRPYIEAMKTAILVYMLVISIMVLVSWGVFFESGLSFMGRMLLTMGAIGFFVSDLFVVRQAFVRKSFLNPLIGLPLYYAAQFSLAMSLAYL